MTTVALMSCVKSKGRRPAAAKDLYTSALFRGMRWYAERHADAWYILSAEHGLVHPDTVLAPYERTLTTMGKADRVAWAAAVQQALLGCVPEGATVLVLAGVRYREGLVPFLERRGLGVAVPMAGLGFRRQLKWLKEQREREAPEEPTAGG